MIVTKSKTVPHWNYFLAIERDLERLSRFVEFDERNYGCFSLEIARILLAAGAEVDVVCKQVTQAASPGIKAENINAYRDVLVQAHAAIPGFEVMIPRHGLSLNPWEAWGRPDGVPAWWTAYNKTKHNRNTHFERANLKNALNAVAGVFVVTLYLYPEDARQGQLVPTPLLVRPGARHAGGTTFGDFDMGFNYNLTG